MCDDILDMLNLPFALEAITPQCKQRGYQKSQKVILQKFSISSLFIFLTRVCVCLGQAARV